MFTQLGKMMARQKDQFVAPITPDTAPPSTDVLLLETGDGLLLETGDGILVE